jgi:hypothetical protein
MRSRTGGRRGDSSRDDEFQHASQHIDLDSLLSEHLGGTRAAEAIVESIESRRKAREERTARRGF